MTRSDVFLGAVLARVVPVRTWRDGIRAFGAHGITAAVTPVCAVVAVQFVPALAAHRREAGAFLLTSFTIWHGMSGAEWYKGAALGEGVPSFDTNHVMHFTSRVGMRCSG